MNSHRHCKLLIVEWTVGGGLSNLLSETESSLSLGGASSLYNEGRWMLRALIEQLSADSRFQLSYLLDVDVDWELNAAVVPVRPGRFLQQLGESAGQADLVWLIAPEFDNQAWQCCQALAPHISEKLISPGPELIEIAADKQRTLQRLASQDIPTPLSFLRRGCQMVRKPRFGAGGTGLTLIGSPRQTATSDPAWVLEPLVPGLPVSVSAIRGPAGTAILPATEQLFVDNDLASYAGAAYPIPQALNLRAQQLARRTIEVLPKFRGFVGIDMVLDPHGTEDAIIEVNPRLTSSFHLLRDICRQNLAVKIVEIARGGDVEVNFHSRSTRFLLPPIDEFFHVAGAGAVDCGSDPAGS